MLELGVVLTGGPAPGPNELVVPLLEGELVVTELLVKLVLERELPVGDVVVGGADTDAVGVTLRVGEGDLDGVLLGVGFFELGGALKTTGRGGGSGR